MFCSYLVLINISWGKSKAFRKMVHHFFFFFVHNWQYFRAFQTSKRDWKGFHMIILKKVKFKWLTLGRCSQDDIFSFAIIRILKEKTKRLQNDSGNKSNRRWSTPSLVNRFQPQSIYYSAVYVLLSFITSLGNSLIFFALHKLLYRCLATTDLLVGIFSQSITATCYMSLVHEHWSLCQYARDAAYIIGYTLCGVSLSATTAISVDRLLALMLGLRYRHTVTLKRTYLIVAIFWVFSSFAGLLYFLNYRITLWLGRIGISLYLLTSIILYTKIFCTLRHHRAEGCGCFVLTSFWSKWQNEVTTRKRNSESVAIKRACTESNR